MNTQALIDILHKEQSLHEKLLIAKREEKRYLAVGDTHLLLKISERISDFVNEADQLETRRMQLTRELAQSLNIEKANPTLSEILQAMPEEERRELEDTRAELKQTLREIAQTNQENTLVLQRSVETLNSRVAQSVKQQESGVYSQPGNNSPSSAQRCNLNLRA